MIRTTFRLTPRALLGVAVAAMTAAGGASAAPPSNLQAQGLTPMEGATFSMPATRGGKSRDPLVSVILKYDSPSLAAYQGGFSGLPATSPAATGRRLNVRSAESQAYLRHLENERRRVENQARSAAPGIQVSRHLSVVVGGVVARVPQSQLDGLRTLPGVTVLLDELHQLDMYRSPEFVGAVQAWARAGGPGNAGEGIIVGILDSGIWPEHPSFSDPDPAGKPYTAPPAKWAGTACDFGKAGGPADAPFSCNNKLIGAQRFMATYEAFTGLTPYEFRSARDDDGHGTHTASTAAGNGQVAPTVSGRSDIDVISGIAPRAHVAAYKVCGELGCYGSDSAAAIQQAILDGVDVLNFSISGGTNPYADVVSLAFLDAFKAGVFVAASAGNSGPGADTVNHRAPWITTVAASQHDRGFRNQVHLAGPSGAASYTGASINPSGVGPAGVIVNTADPLCLSPAAAGSFTGQVVVCRRGTNARTDKSANVAAGGAVGAIIYNQNVGDSLDADGHVIPTSHLTAPDGTALLAFLAANPGATATLTAGAVSEVQGDVLAGFSSRGGASLQLGVLKPDVTGPGVSILAGYTGMQYGTPSETFALLSGTSMSSPHVAGAAALLKQLNPGWGPAEIKSALMTTANTGVLRQDGVTPATPFDTGSGRIDLTRAPDPGLAFSAPADQFETHADSLTDVNQPSVYTPSNPGRMTVRRVARSTVPRMQVWHVSVESDPNLRISAPSSFNLPPGGSSNLDITIDASALPLNAVAHGRLNLRSGGQAYRATLPISVVRRDGGAVIVKTCDDDTLAVKEQIQCDLTFTNLTQATSTVAVRDVLPKQLVLKGVSGPAGTQRIGPREIRFSGSLAGGLREVINLSPTTGVGAGYLPLSLFGIAPIGGMGDESIVNFNVPTFTYNGQTYSRVGVVSNGYVVVGGGSGGDINFINQSFPDTARPNNVLAPFWTDLNPAFGGAVRIGTLTDGVGTWLVVSWEAVRNYSTAVTNSFQIWIGINGTEDIWYTYGNIAGGDGGFVTVGAESADGVVGANWFVDGSGTPVVSNSTQIRVSTTPGAPGESKTISFTAEGSEPGAWRNCAELTSPLVHGTATSCSSGTVTP